MSSFFGIVIYNLRCPHTLLNIGLEHCCHWDAKQDQSVLSLFTLKIDDSLKYKLPSKGNLVGNAIAPSK